MRLLIALIAAFALAACTTVPLTSIPKLQRIDPETTRVSDFMLAISLPRNIRPETGSVILGLTYTKKGRKLVDRKIRLQPVRDISAHPELANRHRRDNLLYVFKIGEKDRIWMERTRAAFLARKKAGETGNLKMNMQSDALCMITPFSDMATQKRARVDTLIRTSETGKFIPVTRGVTIQKIKNATNSDLNSLLKMCR